MVLSNQFNDGTVRVSCVPRHFKGKKRIKWLICDKKNQILDIGQNSRQKKAYTDFPYHSIRPLKPCFPIQFEENLPPNDLNLFVSYRGGWESK